MLRLIRVQQIIDSGLLSEIHEGFKGDSVKHKFEQQLQAVRQRQQQQWLWQCASTGLLCGAGAGCVLAILRIVSHGAFSWIWIILAIALPVVAAVSFALLQPRSLLTAAKFIDRACQLKDRIQTALQFLNTHGDDAVRRLQIEDAAAHLSSVDLQSILPVKAPRTWNVAVIGAVSVFLLGFLAAPREIVQASVASNEVVAEQAVRASESLEELKKFQEESRDADLDKMLKEMNQQLQVLANPGTTPKEALAKLSEMEASLQVMQQQLSNPAAESQLKEIGEALSLAEPTTAAGAALSKGDMQKAAAELSQMTKPQLDRKTEKAVKEKLEQAQQKAGEHNQTKDIEKSLDKMTKGLSNGDQEQFEEGAKALAEECKQQGKKKELSELLKKQSQFLGECKAECESESRNLAQGSRKGGNKAGKGSTDMAGSKTALNKTGSELKLTGQDSGQGDVDKETITGETEEQESVRQYREKAGQYEALSESALESESIPLGQRQTIRRYFELIRPQGREADAVQDELRGTPQGAGTTKQ